MGGEDKRRVNKGYHYIRYGLFGFFLIFLTKMVEWTAGDLVPGTWIVVLSVIVTGLIILMDIRNQQLWRDNEYWELGPDPGPPVITKYLRSFYVICLLGLLFLVYRPTHRTAPQARDPVTVVRQQVDQSALLGRADPVVTPDESKNDQRTLAQQEIETLSAERQTLVGRIEQDKSTIAGLTTQRRQLIEEIEQRQKELVELTTQREEAARVAADQAKVVEAQQQELAALLQALNSQRTAADEEAARLTQHTQALVKHGWTVKLNLTAAIAVIVSGVFVVAASGVWVYKLYYR